MEHQCAALRPDVVGEMYILLAKAPDLDPTTSRCLLHLSTGYVVSCPPLSQRTWLWVGGVWCSHSRSPGVGLRP